MRTRTLLGLLMGLAFLCLGCAPVDESVPARPPAPPAAKQQPAPLPILPTTSKENDALRVRIESALDHVQQRDLLTTHSFWTVFHGILGTGLDATLLNPETGERVNAIEYIRKGGEIRGMEFIPTPHGLDVRTGPLFVGQGHQDQFVAEMAQWGLPADTRFLVHGQEYTFNDFIRHTQMRARVTADQELSWAIVVIGQYLGLDLRWTNSAGEELHFEDLVRYEVNRPIDGAACGGTHRLFGLTWVYHLHRKRGGKVEGVWKDLADRLREYQAKARKYQNPDGSFSTQYLAGPGDVQDIQLRIGTTGHVFEWLSLVLPSSELRTPWMQRAANALALMILDSRGVAVDGGGLYHAAHGLRLYYARVYGDPRALSAVPLPPEEGMLPVSAQR